MSESVDIRRLLQSWPYDANDDARFAQGSDGRRILQVRTPVGIEQYELEGRPDGARPHGMATALEYYEKKLDVAKAAGKESEFELDSVQCAEIFNEGALYYFRYVRLLQLKDWAGTIRDTERNLRAFDFVKSHAGREDDRLYLEKWRPYILRVNATSRAMQELDTNGFDKALEHLKGAIRAIESLDDIDDETFRFERERSLDALKDLARQISKNRPLSQVERLESQLRRAIERQEFEQAAKLRDRIRELKAPGP